MVEVEDNDRVNDYVAVNLNVGVDVEVIVNARVQFVATTGGW